MVQITKTMQPKHFETLSPWIQDFAIQAGTVSLPLLPAHLAKFPTRWPFHRGDLYHWIPLLNRFDLILERFIQEYGLKDGPQVVDFGCKVLETPKEDKPILVGSQSLSELDIDLAGLGYSDEPDRHLIESILNFSRMLLENCGNRSLYASSSYLDSLLNTTSLSLLESTLLLSSQLAQRYHAASKRGPARQSPAVLASHYSITLDRVQQLAQPFAKTVVIPPEPAQPTTPVTPNVKGKEKAYFGIPITPKASTVTIHANDLVSIAKGIPSNQNPKSTRDENSVGNAAIQEGGWEAWGDVKVIYYPKAVPEAEDSSSPARQPTTLAATTPSTPTPIRRSSNLGPHAQRANKPSSSEEAPTTPIRHSAEPSSAVKSVEISQSQVKTAGLHNLLKKYRTGLPEERQYELLTKLRVASALTGSLETRRQILSIRLLAITNLAYIHSESTFTEQVMKQDSDEPRRMQLVSQLADLIHPSAEGDASIPIHLQTLALSTLDSLALNGKFQDVCAALNTNVNHGVLLYVVRKAAADMSEDDDGDLQMTEKDEWRDALFSLLANMAQVPRTGADLVTAGIIPILVEILCLRNSVAGRYYPTIITFLDNIVYTARDAFQVLVDAVGLDAVSSLIVDEVKAASELTKQGKGISPEYRSSSIDYEIPFFRQQSLKWLFKFIHHMMSTAGGYGGNFDRILRNLIDSSPLLGSLREIIQNSRRFGAVVWTNAVHILNDFINNEPTSFAIIAEAGLSKSLLEAVTCKPIVMPPEIKDKEAQSNENVEASSPAASEDAYDTDDDSNPHPPLQATLDSPRRGPLARGILPSHDTIMVIPQAFGAICLNNAGMRMFQTSKALECFFEIFESPEHIKCMNSNPSLASSLGSTFDELVRHHPPLKSSIINVVLDMVARVATLCRKKAQDKKIGAKLWTLQDDPVLPGDSKGKGKSSSDDIEMVDAEIPDNSSAPQAALGPASSIPPVGQETMTPYISVVAHFLQSLFTNSSVRTEFTVKGGVEYLLDLADSPCLPHDFMENHSSHSTSSSLHVVIAQLAEQKPHLVIPSLLKRAQAAADVLLPFAEHNGSEPFFKQYVNLQEDDSSEEFAARGTSFAKALVNLDSLVTVLQRAFKNEYGSRSMTTNFNQLNFSDYYIRLVHSLGPLLGKSIREEIALETSVPASWNMKDDPFGFFGLSAEAERPVATPAVTDSNIEASEEQSSISHAPETTSKLISPAAKQPLTKEEKGSPQYKNYTILKLLLSHMPRAIAPFFQALGKALVSKRSQETFQKQNQITIAEALADVILQQLDHRSEERSLEQVKYWQIMLKVLSKVMVEHTHHAERPLQTITVVLQAFKDRKGFDAVNHILDILISLVRSSSKETVDPLRSTAIDALDHTLTFYSQIVSAKSVTDAVQTNTLSTRQGSDRTRSDYFSPPQFLVELRVAVLPATRHLWESDSVDKFPSHTWSVLIEVIRAVAEADSEAGANKRIEKIGPVVQVSRKHFKINEDHLSSLMDDEVEEELAREALYRCNGNLVSAREYIRDMRTERNSGRNTIPSSETEPSSEASATSRPRTSTSTGTATPDFSDQPMILDHINVPDLNLSTRSGAEESDLERIMQNFAATHNASDAPSGSHASPNSRPQSMQQNTDSPKATPITVEDLNEERATIRSGLVDRCLEIINSHGEVTFDVADLIATFINKSADPTELRSDIGGSVLSVLESFASDEDVSEKGKELAAAAHLLALLMQKQGFYTATASALKDSLPTLLTYVKLSPTHSAENPSPWIPQVLLIIESLLKEDARPRKTRWSMPKTESDEIEAPVLEISEPMVTPDERLQLLESLLDILPRVGKDELLALAVLRILVMLTRSRELAEAMGEKKNIQRLFLMAKQLAGTGSARIQGQLVLVLRHIVEDNETIKQIMRSDIVALFESNRTGRNIDVSAYLRTLSGTIIRAPELFVGVTNELVKFARWSFHNPDVPGRPPHLMLKEREVTEKSLDDSVQPTVQATEDLSIQDVKPSTEGQDSEMTDAPKPTTSDPKVPAVENTDGVIHFLLCELLNYRDVEDKDASQIAPAPGEKPSSAPATSDNSSASTPSGAEMSATKDDKTLKPTNKQEFKPEEHPIFIYRCFILQCLTELLASYNRTKIEFINFKRSAPQLAMTPSKPRSNVINYLLYDLIPIGTLDHAETITMRKRSATSSWADAVLTALLQKTGEKPVDKEREPSDGEDEPDLQFVRRFVLENILKAYREASSSTESLDVKYSRMLALADLMSHIMSGKERADRHEFLAMRNHAQLQRIMFDKGYIGALTGSIADIDLNFPSAKRAVKYILRPLKTLTDTARVLSEQGLVSAPPGDGDADADADEIESATSVSDLEDEREETPDLFRNSTLGMFEAGRDEDSSSSDDDDEEMYEGEYDEEGIDYDEDMEEDDEDNISEEDEDIDGMGPIEGLDGDHGMDVEVIMDDDDGEDSDGSSGDSDDDDEDEEDSDDMDDDDARVEIIDELGNVHDAGNEDDEAEEWESDDDDEEDYEGQAADEEEARSHTMDDMQNSPLGHLVRALGSDDHEGAVEILQRMDEDALDDEAEHIGEYLEEVDEDEEDEEDDMDEEMLFEGYPGTSIDFNPATSTYITLDGPPPEAFDWEGEPDAPMVISHRRPRGLNPFPMFAGGPRDPLGGMSNPSPPNAHALLEELRDSERRLENALAILRGAGMANPNNPVPDYRPSYRSHRPGPPPRNPEDGVNPLLQRSNSGTPNNQGAPRVLPGGWIPAPTDLLDIGLGGRHPFGESPASLLGNLIRTLPFPGTLTRGGQALQFHVTGHGEVPRDLQAMFGITRGSRYEHRREAVDPASATTFIPQPTAARWIDEAKILFGVNHHERAMDIINAIQAVLVPPAIQADKALKAAEAERARKLEEEAKKRAEEERLAKEAKEAEERLAREKKEAEEREAAEKAAAEALAARGPDAGNESSEPIVTETETDAMDTTSDAEPAGDGDAESNEDRPRITTMIRGNPFDITDLGIDAEFLAELPEEIREEVIMSAVAERRSQAAATGAQPSEIDQEFLDALPDDIRDEIIQQERQDRRRREREEQRRQAAASGGNPALDMDPASILATLPPALRQQVLMEQDEEMIAQLPPDLAAQARAFQREERVHHQGRVANLAPRAGGARLPEGGAQRPVRRPVVQMLDKAGVATLLRLMFIFQHSTLRNTLTATLQSVSMNKQNRAEVITTLLHILQDGSADMSAVERSFAQLSVKARQVPKEKEPKTPGSLKRTLTGGTPVSTATNSSVTHIVSEASPLMLVQQCLLLLTSLAHHNQHVGSFFLTEHDTSGSLKKTLSKKGKGKDTKPSKYALNSLLSLLDRNLIMESSNVMESLSTLLNMITQPLQTMERKQKEAVEEATKKAEATAASAQSDTAAPNTEGEASEQAPGTANAETAVTSEQTVEPVTEGDGVVIGGTKSTITKDPEKKLRPFTPPVVPEANLKLVINIFVARECSSKTFRETISTIKNLSTIPGAKTVFGNELVLKAQELGQIILVDLQNLLPQIQKASTGTEIQGVALAKFSPGGSDQNKLLRVLTALDHLFDPKLNKDESDFLSSLYEMPLFTPMWEMLSACLSAIRQREHMLNVATILLPLIEALMVVCKNTTLKDAPISRSQMGKDMLLTSPPPESRMESLFFTFTEEHRKILNDLVRHTPKLMSGTFSLLVKNPKVLEFDNKRNYFSRSIHNRNPQTRQTFPPLQLSVRRDQVFHDSFKSLYFQTGDQMKYGKLSIRFHGEEGVDAGGVTREWFQVLSRQMFDPGYALFIPVSSDRTTFHPNQLSSINEEHLMFFKFIGRIIGKALYEGRVLDCHFSRAVYKRILGKAVSLKDMESLDPDYYKSLVWMLENDITDIITETFSVDNDKFGVVETIDFIENGRNIPVTEENKQEYVRLMVEFKLTGSVKEQLDEFLKGFHEIIPAELVAIFNEQELELLISGLPEIDVDDWKSNTEYHNYTGASPQIQWFWRAIRSFDKEERAKLLQFVTGTSKVPLNGFKELEGMNGFSRFNIHRDYGNKDRLPSSHTCFNQLDLPEYESYETLRSQVLTAITAGSEYFGFA
ncbi:hypothetical protein BP6252_03540 [Coleophoma cylindrospora]|uniref:HECT-type E3 ubiquitin transferase n=1 Tax=Coleophoma cylindrospora TaxID=1849047 RepID=A0A3D8S9F1_9HELO|nr:hypothetical protein BP6252_03540 [Coleophoma cylindrospora]